MARHQVLLLPSTELGWGDLHTILAAMRSVILSGVATSPEQAAAMAASTPPDIIFSALVINDRSLLPLLTELRQQFPGTTIAVCAAALTLQDLRVLGALRVSGYLIWTDFSYPRLRRAVAALLNGVVVGSETVVALVSAALGGQRERSALAASLTPRERAILVGLAAGLTREEIAVAERISVATVKRTIAGLEARLEAPSLFVLGLKAAQLGLLRAIREPNGSLC